MKLFFQVTLAPEVTRLSAAFHFLTKTQMPRDPFGVAVLFQGIGEASYSGFYVHKKGTVRGIESGCNEAFSLNSTLGFSAYYNLCKDKSAWLIHQQKKCTQTYQRIGKNSDFQEYPNELFIPFRSALV